MLDLEKLMNQEFNVKDVLEMILNVFTRTLLAPYPRMIYLSPTELFLKVNREEKL